MMRALLMSESGESLNGLFGACSHCEYGDVVNGLGIKGISRFCSKEFWQRRRTWRFHQSWKNNTAIEHPQNIELLFFAT
jgi:hypothetical protein